MSNIYEHVYTSCSVLVQVNDWPACKRWTRKYLRNAYGGRPAVVANYDMAFADYDAYCRHSRDDMPLYLFDSDFAAKAPLLAGDYTVRSPARSQEPPDGEANCCAWSGMTLQRHSMQLHRTRGSTLSALPAMVYFMHALSTINAVVAGGHCVLEELLQGNLVQAAGPSRKSCNVR